MSKYTLTKPKDRNQFIVTIVADANDGDYITTEETYSKEDFDEYVADALIDLKKNYGGRHQLSDYPNEDDLSIPSNGWNGYCHTLKRITIKHIDENGVTWDVVMKNG